MRLMTSDACFFAPASSSGFSPFFSCTFCGSGVSVHLQLSGTRGGASAPFGAGDRGVDELYDTGSGRGGTGGGGFFGGAAAGLEAITLGAGGGGGTGVGRGVGGRSSAGCTS